MPYSGTRERVAQRHFCHGIAYIALCIECVILLWLYHLVSRLALSCCALLCGAVEVPISEILILRGLDSSIFRPS